MKGDLPRYVLDSFGLLAYFGGEPGEAQVKTVLERAAAGQAEVYLSVVNLGEVAYHHRTRTRGFCDAASARRDRSVTHPPHRSRPPVGPRRRARQGAPRDLLCRCVRRGPGATDGGGDPHGRSGIRQDRTSGRGGVAAVSVSGGSRFLLKT